MPRESPSRRSTAAASVRSNSPSDSSSKSADTCGSAPGSPSDMSAERASCRLWSSRSAEVSSGTAAASPSSLSAQAAANRSGSSSEESTARTCVRAVSPGMFAADQTAVVRTCATGSASSASTALWCCSNSSRDRSVRSAESPVLRTDGSSSERRSPMRPASARAASASPMRARSSIARAASTRIAPLGESSASATSAVVSVGGSSTFRGSALAADFFFVSQERRPITSPSRPGGRPRRSRPR